MSITYGLKIGICKGDFMKTKYVIVEDYNPEWKNEFERIKNELLTVLSGKIDSIEHVGSTSVEGLSAKPIIDLDIVIDNNFEEVKEALESIEYFNVLDKGYSLYFNFFKILFHIFI